MSSPIVVVLAKAKFRKDEEQDLRDFGESLARREKQLLIHHGAGAVEPIIQGYAAGGGKAQQLPKGTEAFDGRYPVVLFTDKRMQDQLDERMPDWRTREHFTVIHNPAETKKAARYARQILAELGTPLSDGG